MYAATLKTPAGGIEYAHAVMTIVIGVFIAGFVLTVVGPEHRNVAFVEETAPAAR